MYSVDSALTQYLEYHGYLPDEEGNLILCQSNAPKVPEWVEKKLYQTGYVKDADGNFTIGGE